MAEVVFDPTADKLTVRLKHSGAALIAYQCSLLDNDGKKMMDPIVGEVPDSDSRDLLTPASKNHHLFLKVLFSYTGNPGAHIELTFDVCEEKGEESNRIGGFVEPVDIPDEEAHTYRARFKLVGKGLP
jgi:hypothetical protein